MFGSSNITVGDFTGRPTDASPASTALALIVDPATDTMSATELQNLPVPSGVVLQNGTAGLTADWDAGSHQIRAETFQSDVATGTAPLTVASTTTVTNLNADLLDGQHGSYYATAADVAALTSGQNRLRTVIARVDNTAAPPTEVEGDRYLLDDTGASHANWDGAAANDVVQFTSGSWVATSPVEGFVVYSDGSNTDWLYVDDGTPDWTERSVASTDHGSLSGLGDDDHPHYGKKAGETWTGAHDFGGADSVELPNSAAPTVDAAGELALDTDVTDWTGMFKYHDGTEELTILAIPTGNMVATDQFGFVYDAAADEIVMQGVLTPYLNNGDTLGGALAGDSVYHDGTTWTNRRKGTDGQVWTMVSGFPDWADATGGSGSGGDAESWTARSATEANNWREITYGGGLFVALSSNGTNRVMTSEDGINWTARSAAEANSWQGITYGNGLFVAVSTAGTNRVMTSPNGIDWTARSAAEANTWNGIAYGNGLFVAVSADGTNRVMTSPDAITWTARSAAEANTWFAVTYSNGLFVAVSSDGTNRVMTSPDGITWTARAAAEANTWNGITYGNGLFVAVSGDGTNRVMTSPDAITWTARSAAEANYWQEITYGNGLFVAVCSNTGTYQVMTSPDGINWTGRTAAEANPWYDIAYGNGVFVSVSTSGTNRAMTSGQQTDRVIS